MTRRELLTVAAAAAAAPAAFARDLAAEPTALVTADLESHVVALDLRTGRRVRELATLPGPRSIERVGDDAVVAHSEAGVVTIVDGLALRVRRVVDGFVEPRYAASVDGIHAYVTDSARAELVTLDVRRSRIVHRLPVDGRARHVAARGNSLLVALGNTAERIAVVDVLAPARPRLRHTFAPPFLAHDVGLAPVGGAWVTSGDRGELALYTGRRRVALFGHAAPQHVTFAGDLAFVTSGDAGTLRVHHAASGRLVASATVAKGSFNVQHDFGWAVIPSLATGAVTFVDRQGRIRRRLHAARSSHDACVVRRAVRR